MQKKPWIIILLLWANALAAQIYPGDANRSGRVDQQDMLYIGYAYGSFGPARVIAGTEFASMPIALDWAESFPDGTGYAYADANGDGLVSITDMLTVVSNYGLEHSPPVEPVYPVAFPGIDPLWHRQHQRCRAGGDSIPHHRRRPDRIHAGRQHRNNPQVQQHHAG